MDFAPEDLALATVPGMDFDPKQRAFNLEELRPQPIIRKRKKNAVPEEMKDERYWDKRTKNKMATRRSREARRLKENQIALRAAFLEKENAVMKKVCFLSYHFLGAVHKLRYSFRKITKDERGEWWRGAKDYT